MDYGKVLSRAWEITWRWKVLWILGFLATLGNAVGSSSSSYSSQGSQGAGAAPWTGDLLGPEAWAAIAGLTLGLICLALIIGIALWVVSIIARGGLVAGVQQVEEQGSTGFVQAWRVGRSRFWTLFGIAVLAALPFLVLMGVVLAVLVAGVLLGVAASDVSDAATATSIVSAVLCGGVLCCGLVLVGLVLEQIRIYAERAAILEGLGWIDAFKRGWEVLKDNLGPTVVLWLIFFVISLVFGLVIAGGVIALAAPFAILVANADPGPWLVVPLCFGGLLGMLVFALLGSIVTTFTSATWTLAYRELTGMSAPQAAEPVVEG